jgi:hypothetical protein
MSCDSQKSHLRLPFQVAFANTTIVHATKGGFPKARSLLIHTCCRMRCTWRMERSMLSRGAPGRPGLPLRSGSSWSCLRPAACVPLRRGSCQRPACGTPSNINDSERRPRCSHQHTTQGPQPPKKRFFQTLYGLDSRVSWACSGMGKLIMNVHCTIQHTSRHEDIMLSDGVMMRDGNSAKQQCPPWH